MVNANTIPTENLKKIAGGHTVISSISTKETLREFTKETRMKHTNFTIPQTGSKVTSKHGQKQQRMKRGKKSKKNSELNCLNKNSRR